MVNLPLWSNPSYVHLRAGGRIMEVFEIELSEGRVIIRLPAQRTKKDVEKLRNIILPKQGEQDE